PPQPIRPQPQLLPAPPEPTQAQPPLLPAPPEPTRAQPPLLPAPPRSIRAQPPLLPTPPQSIRAQPSLLPAPPEPTRARYLQWFSPWAPRPASLPRRPLLRDHRRPLHRLRRQRCRGRPRCPRVRSRRGGRAPPEARR